MNPVTYGERKEYIQHIRDIRRTLDAEWELHELARKMIEVKIGQEEKTKADTIRVALNFSYGSIEMMLQLLKELYPTLEIPTTPSHDEQEFTTNNNAESHCIDWEVVEFTQDDKPQKKKRRRKRNKKKNTVATTEGSTNA